MFNNKDDLWLYNIEGEKSSSGRLHIVSFLIRQKKVKLHNIF